VPVWRLAHKPHPSRCACAQCLQRSFEQRAPADYRTRQSAELRRYDPAFRQIAWPVVMDNGAQRFRVDR